MAKTVPAEGLAVALDVDTLNDASALVQQTKGSASWYKTGLQLMTAVGAPALAEFFREYKVNGFLDIKIPDIPATCKKTAKVIAEMGFGAFNMHAFAGPEAIEQTAANKGNSLLLAVTILTSLTPEQIYQMGLSKCWPGAKSLEDVSADDRLKYIEEVVLHMAKMAIENGADGIICSPAEVKLLRGPGGIGSDVEIWTPAIRSEWAIPEDQNPDRVMTPKKARLAGVSKIIVGRPIATQYEKGGFSGPGEAAADVLQEFVAAA